METQEKIAEFKAELENLIPTPPVGWPIVWHMEANQDYTVPATVAAIQDVGKVVVNIDIAHQPRQSKDGCLHSSHPVHEKRHNALSRNNGSWDYVEGMDIPEAHYDRHRKKIEKKIASLQPKEKSPVKKGTKKADPLKSAQDKLAGVGS